MLTLRQRRSHNMRAMYAQLPSCDPARFIIEPRDYKRNNSDERYYRNRWLLTLLRVYDCRCGICGSDKDGLELDHFWIPKSKGGNFILKSADKGHKINNAVPLCMQCNRNKLDNTFEPDREQAARLLRCNSQMTAKLNDWAVAPVDAELIGYQPGDEMREHELEEGCVHLKRAMRRYRSVGDNLEELKAAIDEYTCASSSNSRP